MSNVQLSKYSDFSGKKFLVVDDFPEFRTAIKRMVEAFGATDVDTASNGEDAVDKIKSKHFDTVLCDYNLGDGKDGQQVLEEAKHTGKLKEAQMFILLTAENTAEMVMGALEYEPDGYLVKPFTKEMVHARLNKVTQKKEEYMQILKALDAKDYDKALKLIDEKIAQGGKSLITALKIKGKILDKKKDYKAAKEFYTGLVESKKLPWTLMGLGRANFYLESYGEAMTCFDEIIELSEVNVEGYDWIANTQLALKQKRDAQETLERAVQLSSKAILRQQKLGDLAFDNHDMEVAEKAYKNAVWLGKHSCYRREQDYLRYGHVLIEKARNEEHGRISIKAATDAVGVLDTVVNLYRNDRKVQAPANTLLALAHQVSNRKDKAKVYIKKALELVERDNIKMDPAYMVMLGEAMVDSEDDDLKERGEVYISSNSGGEGEQE